MEKLHEVLITHRRNLHKIPEIGMEVFKTHSYIKENLIKLNVFELEEFNPTGLTAFYRGNDEQDSIIGFRADMDGLPIEEETELNFCSENENMHACGHDGHMAVLLAFAQWISEVKPKKNILLIFQPGEEGQGGAEKMLKQGLFSKLKPDFIYALHVNPELNSGTIAVDSGPYFAAASEFHINLKGKGGHAAYSFKYDDLVFAGSNLVVNLHSIIDRNINPENLCLLEMGMINIGTKMNILPSHGKIEGTIRTFNDNLMIQIKDLIKKYCISFSSMYDITIDVKFLADYPVLYNSKEASKNIEKAAEKSNISISEYGKKFTGEDFAFFAKEVPGALFWLGTGFKGKENYPLHNSRMNIDENSLLNGLKVFQNLAL